MIEKNLLELFQIDSARATKNGDFLAEYVSGLKRYTWDSVNKCYIMDKPRATILTAWFCAIRKSKLAIVLPPDALTEKEIEELNAKADAGEDISLDFKGLKIGLKSGYNGDITITATTDSVEIV